MEDQRKTKILAFLGKQKLAVISTTAPSNPTPESALIGFAEDEQLCIYFQTKNHTRKAANLSKNPNVSLVIGLRLDDMATLQYEGKAQQIVKTEDLEVCKKQFAAKGSPSTKDHFSNPTTIFFKVTPTWIGFSDYSDKSPEVIEIKDFS